MGVGDGGVKLPVDNRYNVSKLTFTLDLKHSLETLQYKCKM